MPQAPEPKRIAILGAESTGKSTLAEALAAHFKTLWVPEYLREFVTTHGRTPCEEDQFGIAVIQAKREDDAARHANRYLFCDTTPLMTALYSQFYWQRIDSRLAAFARERRYDITLVTSPDIPWAADGMQRESDEVRQTIHVMLLAMLKEQGTCYELISGSEAQRVDTAAVMLERLA